MDAAEEDVAVCPSCGAPVRQDEDVLDTWFSSQLWPFATYGWPSVPGHAEDLAANYPTQVLSTARDIIFLWVARMVMSSLYFLDGKVPFEDVIIHPTVLDKYGNIMSKSRGNGIDPLELIEEYGADSMRFGLALQVTGSQDLKFDKEKIMTMARNFTTKIWNASRFVQMNLPPVNNTPGPGPGVLSSAPDPVTPSAPRPVTLSGAKSLAGDVSTDTDVVVPPHNTPGPGPSVLSSAPDPVTLSGAKSLAADVSTDTDVVVPPFAPSTRITPQPVTDADRWILSRLARLTEELAEGRSGYDFGAIARSLYSFFWNEFCDWYIELAKGQLAQDGELCETTQRNLVFVLDTALRLLHPFMPFLTETIWQSLPHGDTVPSLMVAAWPDAGLLARHIDPRAERAIDDLCAVVGAVRAARARYGISPKEPLAVVVKTTGEDAAEDAGLLSAQASQVESMARTSSFTVSPDAEKPAQSSVTIAPSLEIYIVLEGLVDFEAERARLTKEREKKAVDLQKLEKKLSNEGFLAKADAAIVEKTKTDATELATAITQIDQQLTDLA
jgi:valyl-tRNA synthetase